ncbi:RNA polymerase factor sigma-54 [Microvirga sp. 2TAF3]|uniref:RNA polymerase factor sigma-54 n=1 Tax=Microvirga sp. 2TAF3 TaxID=3233014 RepID=UPI003F9E1CF2
MSSTQRLELRQGQSLTMTPQLLQSIKLLQLSHLELCAYVEAELERNPLLQQVEGEPAGSVAGKAAATARNEAVIGRIFPHVQAHRRAATMAGSGGGGGGSVSSEAASDLDSTLAGSSSLAEHLEAQLDLATVDPVLREIGRYLIRNLDEAGYLAEDLEETADRLGMPPARAEAALALIQGFEPTGIGARSLAECLALQLRERDRLDRPMEILLGRLDLVARGDFAALQRLCGVDGEDLDEMLAEIRRLEPKPGLAFAPAVVDVLVPDVLVRAAPEGGFVVELNPHTLPRILFDKSYYATVAQSARSETDKSFLSDCLQSAHWLTRSLDQRATTILKVATEIVRRQEDFFRHGVAHLRPLTLRAVAEEIGMHESTISRVTANKAIGTIRGTFPMKYFFGGSLSGAGGGHSSKAVRHRIRQLVEAEQPGFVLSDDAIAQKLKADGIDIARRTVAKYREALLIPSSALRRRIKKQRRGP